MLIFPLCFAIDIIQQRVFFKNNNDVILHKIFLYSKIHYKVPINGYLPGYLFWQFTGGSFETPIGGIHKWRHMTKKGGCSEVRPGGMYCQEMNRVTLGNRFIV